MKKTVVIIINFLFLVYSLFADEPYNKLKIFYNESSEMILILDSQFHIDYGFSYPTTFKLQIPINSTELKVLKKYNQNEDWVKMTEKTSNDFFNGIEAVRFDYDSNLVYLSVGFSSISDSIFLKITNTGGNNSLFDFVEICKYYDNRKAVVTTTADDLRENTAGFQKAFKAFRDRKLWLSCAAITGKISSQSWIDIQNELDLGFIEIDSHSRSHIHTPYPDVEYEVVGSKEDIINNLNLPAQYKNGELEYVYSYIYPYGNYDGDIDRIAGLSKYLICRTVKKNNYNYTEWNSNYNLFDRVGVVYEVGGVYSSFSGVSDINLLKSTFDEVIQRGEIYHFSIHPNAIESIGDWEKPYMSEHLDYISNRKNIWYVGFGHLYLYHFLAIDEFKPKSIKLDIKIYLQGAFSDNNKMNTKLNSIIPNNQPFEIDPWNYKGTETVSSIPNSEIVDWILVSLKNNPTDLESVARRAGFLKKDGHIVDLDGESPLRFSTNPGSYYIQIEHRNHLPIMSSSTINLTE